MGTTFQDELTIMRRFLRDPEGNIWSDEDLMTYWNDSQREMAIKAGYAEKARTFAFPPEWTWGMLYLWEYGFADGDRRTVLISWEGEDATICYPWEPGYFLDEAGPADEGYRHTQAWEGLMVGSPADYIPFPLHADLQHIRYLAYDEQGLSPMDRKGIALSDSLFRTATGTPVFYWRPDMAGNEAVLYPRPANVTWDDDGLLHSPVETYDDAGGINTWSTDVLNSQESGIILDAIGTENTVFVLFESVLQDVAEPLDEIDTTPYLVKYIRYGCLERALGADTDGFVPTLRDYWRSRKEIGYRAIKKLNVLKCSDRDYRLGGGGAGARSRHPRLPSAYPRQDL